MLTEVNVDAVSNAQGKLLCTEIVFKKIGDLRPEMVLDKAQLHPLISLLFLLTDYLNICVTYGDNPITGKIHNLIHAGDTVVLATHHESLISKVKSRIQFFDTIKY